MNTKTIFMSQKIYYKNGLRVDKYGTPMRDKTPKENFNSFIAIIIVIAIFALIGAVISGGK
ncbi:hypothetical protein ACVW0P_004506 [Mucilaginibacter sp. UYNi724]